MKRNFIFLLLPFLIAACSQEQENDSKSETSEYAFFVEFIDSTLTNSFGKDLSDYYQKIKTDSFIVYQRSTAVDQEDEVQQFYLGEIELGDMPVSCRLYELNLQGLENEKEFVGVLESSPLIGGAIDLFIFNSERKLIDKHSFAAFRNENSSFSFVDLNDDKNYEIIIDADIHRSVYDNKAKHIVNVENDSSEIVFSELTYFYDNQRFDEDYDLMDSSYVQLVNGSPGTYPKIQVETKRYKIDKADTQTQLIGTEKQTHFWNQETLRYVLDSVSAK